ncbi:NAD(P)/FAD-dependent oxidoreductase [Kerstersia gyiorum]|uniref:NAD(P)/FAD-dependent oxidoreductase n=1 Tax=Kerstersia gyiorum TaxID=206506 RepID=UPI0039E92B5B
MKITRRKLLIGAGAGVVVAGGAAVTPMLLRDNVLEATTSRALPVAGDDTLPASADVVIVGAGMIGVATALYLAERGLSVVICEKGVIAGEQSSRAYGQVTSYGLDGVTELIQHSKYLWRGMNEKIGADTSYRTYGRVQACANDEDVAKAEAWLADAREHAPEHAPIRGRFLEGAELEERLPGARTPWKTAFLQEDDGSIEPAIGASMLARYVQTQGVKIVTNCAVRGFETEAGAVSGVITEKGPIRAKTVVVAGGYWSRLFCGNAGINLPLLPVYLSQQRISDVAGAPPACGHAGIVVWRKEVDGTYSNGPRYLTAPITRDSFALAADFLPTIGKHLGLLHMDLALNRDFIRSFQTPSSWKMDEVTPFELARVTAPTPNNELLDTSLSWLRGEFPVFENAKVVERWGGVVNVANDLIPVISDIESVPGLFVSSGFDFGLTQGPAAGQLMADMITGETPKVDPKPFHLSRLL